ncbi:hypothetical protein KCP73_03505 [Salmonella enterica subsp. enterica]|nr:hypothetical protein KCP73_03505 [Salmonella enterica subsp. enterica]
MDSQPRKGAKEANKDIIAKGIEPIEIGWIRGYDATIIVTIWSPPSRISAPTNCH